MKKEASKAQWMTVAQLAARWSASHNHARKIAIEELGVLRLAGSIRISVESVEEKEAEASIG